MKKRLGLDNSIYQNCGLDVKNGRLINGRIDGETGISQLSRMKKAVHKAEKIATMSTAFTIGENLSDISEYKNK